jgi:hypothetical protein
MEYCDINWNDVGEVEISITSNITLDDEDGEVPKGFVRFQGVLYHIASFQERQTA